jgi:hypothetical protein
MKMKSIEVDYSKEPPVTPEILAEAEKQLGVVLPEGYRQFLLLHNGGHPKQDIYGFAENDNSSEVHRFFAIYDGSNTVNLLIQAKCYRDSVPREFLVIGRDGGGSRICLGVREPYYNQVYFWDFNEAPGWMDPEFYEPPTFDNMYLLAHSFEEFINKLHDLVLQEDENGKEVAVYIHDRYSLPLSTAVRKYQGKVLDFFAQAPAEVKDFMIEYRDNFTDFRLCYIVPFSQKKYYRRIYGDGSVVDSEEFFPSS